MTYHRLGRQEDAVRALRVTLRLGEASPDAAEAKRVLAILTKAEAEGAKNPNR